MADLWQLQSSLNSGELDPLLLGRTDLQAYYNGLQTAKNMLSFPQGGMKKRPGTEFVASTFGDGRIEKFSFSTEQNYLLVFTALKMEIFKDNVLQTNIAGSGNDYLAIPWTLEQIKEFDYIQSADTIIITHEDVETRVITRTSDTAWTISTASFTNIPQYDFNDASSPTPVSEVQRLTFTDANSGDRFKLSLNGILTGEIVLSLSATGTEGVSNSITDELLALPNTGFSGISTSWISATVYEVTFSGASANDWDEMIGTGIYSRSPDFRIVGSTITNGTSRGEDVWSSTRGWPRTCTFHENRLWFGGSASRPSTIWGSNVADYFNFKTRKALDDEAISVTLDTDQINAIEAIFSNRSLQVFTSGGEFYAPKSPITPENVSFTPQSNLGTKRVRPVTVDGITLFIQRTGKALVQFVYKDEIQANQAQSLSFIASHLIKDPIKLAVRRGTTGQDANYVFLCNDDGTMTVFNTLTSEGVSGFTRWETAEDSTGNGEIISVASIGDYVYTLVQREIDSSTVYYIEVESDTAQTDSAVIGTSLSSDTLTGLDHLEGETVHVKADGAYQGTEVVSSGEITIERTADTIEAGLGFFPEIKTMPLNVSLPNGPNASSKKKIARASVQLYESNGVIINGQRLADRTIGQDQFDAPEPQTGFKRIHLLGWSIEAQITVTQDTPMPLTLLSIGNEVKT